LDNKVIYDDYLELPEQLLEEDNNPVEDNKADQEL
jgi:hypothetical protein